jgi:CubicO group peptidase (beta-lactamase class C family)
MNRVLAIATVAAAISWALAACAPVSQEAGAPGPTTSPASGSAPVPGATAERLTEDTPKATVEGNTFIAPTGWRISVRGPATILEAPEGDSRIALVDVRADSAEAAVAAAWQAYEPDASWPLAVVHRWPGEDGWTDHHEYVYETSPGENRLVSADALRAGEVWTVAIYDMDAAVADKRTAEVSLIYDDLHPKGYTRESFAGRSAHDLDPARIAELSAFVERAMQNLRVPGVAIGLVQDGRVVFADGFGVREIGGTEKVDADTLFMIGSNTKALTTLMLAKLVDEGKLTWETPAMSALPSFRLGDPDTTRRVQIEHLICACTGLPRQDGEMVFQFEDLTPAGAVARLANMQPTSEFGEMFQYSNPLAAAAGYVGGHVAFPDLELGAAYDEAMRTRVFEPLGMASTTFDYARALSGNCAMPHARDIHDNTTQVAMDVNYSIIPVRPAGAAWSNVRDVLRYVAMELADGALPDGTRYISRETLLARRAPQVSIGKHATYGMGLVVDTEYGIPVVHHGGGTFGYLTDMMWLPEHGVGAVVLTNDVAGWILMGEFRRKLLEVLFDGLPKADDRVAAAANAVSEEVAAVREMLSVPADAAEATRLARRYVNEALGSIAVRQVDGATVFDFGEWRSEVGSRKSADGSVSFVTIVPGLIGLHFVVGDSAERTLTLRIGQHEYLFRES